MAILYPSLEENDKMLVKPTDGEIYLLKELNRVLPDEYEVFS